MNESKWVCARCRKAFDLGEGEGWVTLAGDEDSYYKGKLTPLAPYEEVCYECTDELLAIIERCNGDCGNCDVTVIWGLSIMDCLRFQLKFGLLHLPQKEQPPKGSVEEAKEILRMFERF